MRPPGTYTRTRALRQQHHEATPLRPCVVRNAANVSHPLTALEEGGRLSFCEKADRCGSRHLAVHSRARRCLSRAIGDTAIRAADARGKDCDLHIGRWHLPRVGVGRGPTLRRLYARALARIACCIRSRVSTRRVSSVGLESAAHRSIRARLGSRPVPRGR